VCYKHIVIICIIHNKIAKDFSNIVLVDNLYNVLRKVLSSMLTIDLFYSQNRATQIAFFSNVLSSDSQDGKRVGRGLEIKANMDLQAC
jgi:hypothetical protein